MKKQVRSYSSYLKNLYRLARYIIHWMSLANQIRRYNQLKKSPPVVLCIANPGSIGGTELQIQIIAESLKHRLGDCLILMSGQLEGGKSNRFLEEIKSLKIPFLLLRSVGLARFDLLPILKKGTIYLLRQAIGTSKICHFFNPSSTALAPLIKIVGLSLYYMETGMPVLEGWWTILHDTIDHFSYVTSVSLAGLRRLESLYGYKRFSSVICSMHHLPSKSLFTRKPIKNVFDVVYFGRMTRGKGVDLLIRSFRHVVSHFPYAKLFLIGSGETLDLFQQLVKKLDLSGSIQFTVSISTDHLFSRLTQFDLFCLPSYTEGLPCSVLEAMSIGLPVVSTDVGGVSEVIEHNLSGILIPAGDEEALTNTLLELAVDPVRRAQLGKEAHLRWQKVASREAIMDQLMKAYQPELLQKS